MIPRFLLTNGPRDFFIFENDFENLFGIENRGGFARITADMSIKPRVQRPSCEMALW